MSKRSEEAAFKAYPFIDGEMSKTQNANAGRMYARNIFKKGYEQAEKDFLEQYGLKELSREEKAKPEFKAGDWIISDKAHEDYRICKIIEVDNGNYKIESIHGYCGYNEHKLFDSIYRLWTIDDAKPGDIVAVGPIKKYTISFVAIYKEQGLNSFNSYCFVAFDGEFYEGSTDHLLNVHPATKEQHNLLFQKMHEAGYDWDSEKLELKKIKPTMIKWTGDNLREVLDITGKASQFNKWFSSFDEYEKYVHSHDNIFKLFNEDGSHYEVPVGAWIVKTPDGCNIASKATYVQKSISGEINYEDAFSQQLKIWFEKGKCSGRDEVIFNPENFGLRKPIEWSEEDETNLKEVLSYIKDDALKTFIKKRIQLQQEWSEEDEKMWKGVIAAIEYLRSTNESWNYSLDWLKHIKRRMKGE